MKAYQLKIQIKDSHPPIWRRVIIPAGLSFAQLSLILNEVMGWCGYHLSSFEFYHLKVRIEDKLDELDIPLFQEYTMCDMAETIIDAYLDSEEWFTYIYDFGDWWEHRVTIEKRLTDYDKNYAQVIKFKGDTPYEDCGGIDGYYHLLKILGDENHPEHEEMKEWTEDQFPSEYDRESTNEILQELYLTDKKSEPVSQRELYRRFLEGNFPFDQINGVEEIAKPSKDMDFSGNPDWNISEDSILQNMMNQFKEYMMEDLEAIENEEFHLDDILISYGKKELLEIAKIHHLKGCSKYNKKELAEFLCREIVKEDVIKRYFKYLNHDEVELLEQKEDTLIISFDDTRFDALFDGGYIGYTEVMHDGILLIPTEVKSAYRKWFSGNWYAEYAEDRKVLCYLNALTELYGICPLDKFIEIFKLHTATDMTKDDVLRFCKEVPENQATFAIKDNFLVHKPINNRKTMDALMRAQGDKDYYLPTVKEIISLGKQGYLPFDRHMQRLEQYIVKQGEEEKEEAQDMCKMVAYIIRVGGRMQDVMDYLEESMLAYEEILDEIGSGKELIKLIQDVWNHTRMHINRGFTPMELAAEKQEKASLPDNVIPFPSNKLH